MAACAGQPVDVTLLRRTSWPWGPRVGFLSTPTALLLTEQILALCSFGHPLGQVPAQVLCHFPTELSEFCIQAYRNSSFAFWTQAPRETFVFYRPF
jgi:hypothetical protein